MLKLRRFLLNKLIRDKMLNLDGGAKVKLKMLDEKTAIEAFKSKLKEEITEVVMADTIENLKQELADVLEVVHGFAHAMQISFEDIEKIRQDKKETRGGFEEQLFVEYVDLPDNHPYIAYNLSQPDKTPEIPYQEDN